MNEREKDRNHEQKLESNAVQVAQKVISSNGALSTPLFNITVSQTPITDQVSQLYSDLDGESGGGKRKEWVDIGSDKKRKKKMRKKK